MRGVEPFDNPHRVRGPVEEVRIAERDVAGACRDLTRDVGEDDLGLHHAELAVVDRDDRTVAAQMTAAAARLGVTDQRARAISALQRGVAIEPRQAGPIGHEEMKTRGG